MIFKKTPVVVSKPGVTDSDLYTVRAVLCVFIIKLSARMSYVCLFGYTDNQFLFDRNGKESGFDRPLAVPFLFLVYVLIVI